MTSLFVIAALVIVQAAQPPRDRPVAAGETGGSIEGRVLDARTDAPLRRAVVRLSAPELPRTLTMRTDADGRYSFSDLPAGRYAVRASKPRYLALDYGQRRPFEPGRRILLGARERLQRVDVPLQPAGVIAGRVLDPAGEPIDRVWVQVFRMGFDAGARRLVSAGRAVTNDIGEYRLSGLAPGDYYVFAREMAVPPGPNTHDTFAYASTFYPGVRQAQDAERVAVGLGQEILNLDLTMPIAPTAVLSGRAIRADGTPVAGVRVDLLDGPFTGSDGNVTGGAPTDADGRFRISGVGLGSYRLAAIDWNPKDRQSGTLPVEVVGADQPGLTLVIGPGGTMTGRVVSSSGEPLPFSTGAVLAGARVADWSSPLNPGVLRLAPDWTFEGRNLLGPRLVRVPRLPAGWWMKAVIRDGQDVTDMPIHVEHDQTVGGLTIVLDDKPTVVDGRVVDAAGAAIEDYTVIAFSPDRARWGPETRFIEAGRPDHAGRFRLTALPPGEYLLVAVDYVETGQWLDPAYLESLRRRATAVTLEHGQNVPLELVSKIDDPVR